MTTPDELADALMSEVVEGKWKDASFQEVRGRFRTLARAAAKAAWEEGFYAASEFDSGPKGTWVHNDKRGTRTWHPAAAPGNPYAAEEPSE